MSFIICFFSSPFCSPFMPLYGWAKLYRPVNATTKIQLMTTKINLFISNLLNIINYITTTNLLHLKTLNLIKHLLPHQKNKMHQELFYKKYVLTFQFFISFVSSYKRYPK